MTNSSNERYMPWLDVAKGIGIILVVIDHAIFPKHLIIDGFHMPLFFILAGITFSTKGKFVLFLKKKFIRLMIPCIFFAFIWYITGIPNLPIWFLYTIFFAYILLYILAKNIRIWILTLIIFIISLLLSGTDSVLPWINSNIVRIIFACHFMFIGYWIINFAIRPNILRLEKFVKKNKLYNILLFSVIVYLVILLGGEKLGLYSELSFGKCSLFRINYFLMLIITLLGSFVVILVSVFLQRIRVLRWFGQNSLIIMCVHFPLAESLNHLISTLPYFNNILYKIGYGLIEYVILILFSVSMTLLCNKYIPFLVCKVKLK